MWAVIAKYGFFKHTLKHPNALTDYVNTQLQHYADPVVFLDAFDTHAQNSILLLEDVLTTNPQEPIRKGLKDSVSEYKAVLTINTLIRQENSRP